LRKQNVFPNEEPLGLTLNDPASVTYEVIGVVRSPHSRLEGMPLQSVAAQNAPGEIEVKAEYEPALKDLDGFSHVWVVSHLHRSERPTAPVVMPFLDDVERGLFSTRSPRRPNPIGLSVVRLLSIEHATLQVDGLDLLDGTPVLDLKPYVPLFDSVAAERTGWLAGRAEAVHSLRSDTRYEHGASPAGGEELLFIVDLATPEARTRWTIVRSSGPVVHRHGMLLAPEGKTLTIGETLSLPPDTRTRWLVVSIRNDAEHPDGGIATVDALP
jgi:tRNA-Thr(GGU) m(6)t(6)A37 methyltransferase TsaA